MQSFHIACLSTFQGTVLEGTTITTKTTLWFLDGTDTLALVDTYRTVGERFCGLEPWDRVSSWTLQWRIVANWSWILAFSVVLAVTSHILKCSKKKRPYEALCLICLLLFSKYEEEMPSLISSTHLLKAVAQIKLPDLWRRTLWSQNIQPSTKL